MTDLTDRATWAQLHRTRVIFSLIFMLAFLGLLVAAFILIYGKVDFILVAILIILLGLCAFFAGYYSSNYYTEVWWRKRFGNAANAPAEFAASVNYDAERLGLELAKPITFRKKNAAKS